MLLSFGGKLSLSKRKEWRKWRENIKPFLSFWKYCERRWRTHRSTISIGLRFEPLGQNSAAWVRIVFITMSWVAWLRVHIFYELHFLFEMRHAHRTGWIPNLVQNSRKENRFFSPRYSSQPKASVACMVDMIHVHPYANFRGSIKGILRSQPTFHGPWQHSW